MKKYFSYFFLVLFVSSSLFFFSCNKSSGGGDPEPPAAGLGPLVINPNNVIINQANVIFARVAIPFGVILSDSVIVLNKVDANNAVIAKLGELLDNGNLNNGDEIKGDNIFSGRITISENTPGQMRMLAVGKISGKETTSDPAILQIYGDLSGTTLNQVLNTQENATTQLNTYLAGNINNLDNAVDQTKTWIQSQPGVSSVEKTGNTSILINYTSGLKGGLIVNAQDANGSVDTRGGFGDDPRKSTPTVPLYKQTVGTPVDNYNISSFNKTSAIPANVVGNRNVLIYAPFEAAFAPQNEAAIIKQRLNESKCQGFTVTHLSNEAADISALANLTDYGYVVLATHGSQGKQFATGEVVDTNKSVYRTTYKALLLAGKLAIWRNVTVSYTGGIANKKNIYAVSASYISNLTGTFPNSIILNNSCESTMNPDLQNAFIGKGAKTYYGYSKVVSSRFCVIVADTLTKRLAVDNKNTGAAYWDKIDPYRATNPARFEIKGANDVSFGSNLLNGDFEEGTLAGWTKSGDGRVISGLGSLTPPQGKAMGIISSGLGFTTASGSISQCVTIPQNATTLTLKWNFLSEEFLEYIGSIYQDYFRIKIIKPDGTEAVLFSKTIDGIAAMFGATKENAGSLISVSPGIVFDKGGVYMTNWQNASFDITAYRGQTVNIVFMIGDVGDSIFDSAALLDLVEIK